MTTGTLIAWGILGLGLLANAIMLSRVYGILRNEVEILKKEISEQRQLIFIMEARHLGALDSISKVRADIAELSVMIKMALDMIKSQSELIEKLRK